MARQPGLVSMTAAVPRRVTPDKFFTVMVWEDVNALRAFAGEHWREPQ